MDYFIFWRMYELFHRFYRYKFVGEIHLDKSRLNAPFWGSMPRNTVLRIASSLWMMATPAQTLTALHLLK